MHPIDIILLLLIGIAMIRGVSRGFFQEVFTLGSVAGGVLCGILLSRRLATLVGVLFGVSRWNTAIAFIIIFLLFYIVMKISEGAVQRGLSHASLRNLDKALGLIFGLVEAVVVILILTTVLYVQPFINVTRLFNASIGLQLCAQLVPRILEIFGLQSIAYV